MKGYLKGKRGEREVAKLLSGWLGIELRRTPLSGGLKNFPSDIIPDSITELPLIVEVKYQENWSLEAFLEGKNAILKSWINQVEAEAKRIKKKVIWMLFFRRNRVNWFVLFPSEQAKFVPKPYICIDDYVIVPFAVLRKYKPEQIFEIK